MEGVFLFFSYSYLKNGANEKNIGKVAETIEKVAKTIGIFSKTAKSALFLKKVTEKFAGVRK